VSCTVKKIFGAQNREIFSFMNVSIIKTSYEEVALFRVSFLKENNFQFILDKAYRYGWADTYLFAIEEKKIGYGSVWGKDKREDRDAIFEFYIIPSYRQFSSLIFPKFQTVSNAPYVEAQTNDLLLSTMLFEFTRDISAEAILFEDYIETNLAVPGTIFTRKPDATDNPMDAGGYLLTLDGEVVASGGLMLNYNLPFADIYMEVKENHRQKGFGSLIVQELKKEAYRMERVPAARCNIDNKISKSTLLKAGFRVCGCRVVGRIRE